MPYFYVSRCKAPHPFASAYMTAGVIEATDLDAAKAQLVEAMRPAVAKGLDGADAYEIKALDEQPRSESGFVVGSFASQD